MFPKIKPLLVCVVAGVPSAAYAQTDVPFGGVVAQRHYCEILVQSPGVLAASVDFLELSSRQAGGVPGSARVTTTNGSYRASIDVPTGFIAYPQDGATGVSYSTLFEGTGATVFPDTSGATPVKLKRGVTEIDTHFIATRSGSTFPAGGYSAELVLRCE